ncbi:KHG/KDPG aldolase [Candidatus Planktophila sp.]|jgi:2-dehydro-3-deoxyphosphogluconate aldolase/(4S)-4-hydroxy-2-oxoglutarate aldolase|uniref:2-dehydro-3-deoxyphosphogluconate aldolase / (4S)-4-hydroxy-2-oxoglutarate aldolase n=1 Tax=Candidatus Nanopelagicus limnae TaxID=1884634 RepID=A0A249JX64_9ACTN|nr:bifunctional 4-hydroxy-2-oxoglutarate aldolase/2-dehydro-3-deoxy-phosphogluconate aldolase [Candidatus Nanopelagicus limnes]ASY09113.1 2-dehydro-3-deoxyphosphogluconate aldolase / (4S)-4-hydroxy-2-oxoglutarate aldolase [Candidatus Nanopelagicus limnes]MBJ7507094.1 bifunctional 4-hydroxy-2-oxoglutarate aldolase/2-dehydro-3-deoxy-phosphogluconate aldolase [Candidatus Nanopelagicus sp.]GBL25785.1 KHG/KDPG aldolase [Candidatus Planktophila sp.]
MKTVDKLLAEKMMTLVRCNTQAQGQEMADALVDAGVKVIEITLTTPGALKIIEKLLKNKDLLVGAGTVRTVKDVKKVEAIGARFIVSPDTNEDVITATKKLKLVSMPGVSTPTEVGIAVDAGADILKLFPASVLGPAHLKSIREPFPNNRWCPTAGVTLESIPKWFEAGADLVGLGGPLTKDGAAGVRKNVLAFRSAIDQASKVVYQHEVSQ